MKRKPRFNYNRWGFQKMVCPYCLKEVSRNWYARHVREKHPEWFAKIVNSLVKS